jgi:DNA repair exonuclease SbcCD ATPase subunit
MSLFDLAAAVQAKTERLARSRESGQLAQDLRERVQQLTAASKRAELLEKNRAAVVHADSKLRVRSRALGARIKKIAALEQAVQTDPKTLTARDAYDAAGLDAALNEVEGTLKDAWRKFARPAREIAIDAVEGDPDAERLRTLRQELQEIGSRLPAASAEADTVTRLKREIGELTDRLLASGYDEDVLQFLSQARSQRGVNLGDVLANPKVLAWLQQKRNAAVYRVSHENASATGNQRL